MQLQDGNYEEVAKWMGRNFEYRPRIRMIRIWQEEWQEWAVVEDGVWIIKNEFGWFERYSDFRFRHEFHKAEDRDDELRTLVIDDGRYAGYEFVSTSEGTHLERNGFVDEAATRSWNGEIKGYDQIIWRHK